MSDDKSWSTILKTVSRQVASEIPYVGKLVQLAVDLLWPATQPSIWDQIKDDVNRMIDFKIVEHEISEVSSQLSALHDDMKQYADYGARYRNNPIANAGFLTQMGEYLTIMVTKANDLYELITKSENAVNLIPMLVALAPVELTILREQYQHGELIYKTSTDSYKQQLEGKLEAYIIMFSALYDKWEKWRLDQIEYTYERYSYYLVNDKVSNRSYKVYDKDITVAREVGFMLLQEAVASMGDILSGAYLIENFSPEKIATYNWPHFFVEDLRYLSTGIYTDWSVDNTMLGGFKDPDKLSSIRDMPGTVDSITVHYEDSFMVTPAVTGMQFFYADHEGHLAGKTSDKSTIIKNPYNNHIVGFNMSFFASEIETYLASIQAIYRDGSTSPLIGKKASFEITAAWPQSYEVADITYRIDRDRIAAVQFSLRYRPQFTTIVANSYSTGWFDDIWESNEPITINGLVAAPAFLTYVKNKEGATSYAGLATVVLRPDDGAVVFAHSYTHRAEIGGVSPAMVLWNSFYRDMTNQMQKTPNGIIIFSLFNFSGSSFPPQEVCSFLEHAGAGNVLDKWVNNPDFHQTSGTIYSNIAYIFAGWFGAGKSNGIEVFQPKANSETGTVNIIEFLQVIDGKLSLPS